MIEVDNLTGREEDKLARLDARFARVTRFLEYLSAEEAIEGKAFGLSHHAVFGEAFMPSIVEKFNRETAHIVTRVKENREKYEEGFGAYEVTGAPEANWFEDTESGRNDTSPTEQPDSTQSEKRRRES